jgi:transposase
MRKPDATLAEPRAWLIEERGAKVGVGRLWKRPRRLGPTLKKKTLHAAEQDRPDVAEAREKWRASQPDPNPEHLVFIDESVPRRHGRSSA